MIHQNRPTPGNRRVASLGVVALIGVLLVLAPASTGSAGVTDPALALLGARVDQGTTSRVLVLEGVLPSEDLLQGRLRVLVLVRETTNGTGYALFDLGGATTVGDEAAIADGVTPGEAAALTGGGVSAQGGLLFLGEDRLDLRLPAEFASGPAEVLVFALEPPTAVLSNVLVVGGLQ